jgi:hypothetical protein
MLTSVQEKTIPGPVQRYSKYGTCDRSEGSDDHVREYEA